MARSSPSTPSQPLATSLPTVVIAGQDDDIDVDALVSDEPGTANLAELLGARARERPAEVALVQAGAERRALTWSELDEQVSSLAAGLARHGVLAGHRLALRGPTSIEYVRAYLAALRAGVVAVPLGLRAGSDQSARWLAESGARLLLSTDVHERDGAGRPGADRQDAGRSAELEALPLSLDGLAGLSEPGGAAVVTPPDPEALAVLLYTAGTAEEPRPVMLSHRALLAGLDDGPGRPDVDAVIGSVLPMSGAYGLLGVLGSWLRAGCRLVVADDRTDLAEVASTEQVTHLPLTPPMIVRMLQRAGQSGTDLRAALGSVRSVVSAGARLPWPLVREFSERTGLRIEQAYGLTETGRGVSSTLGGELLGPGHVGRPLPGVEVRIGDGGDDEPGEIWVRGAVLFSGYWPDGRGGPGPEGWWNTGDLGYVDGSELFLLDRAADVVHVSGFTVYPAEIEQVIAELDGVDAVAVIGTPDPAAGQRMVAFVSGRVDADAVADFCRARLAAYKRPKEIRTVDQLPRTITGLVRRGALRRLLGEESAESSGTGA